MQIFLARNNVQAGPYTLDEVNTMLASGEVLLTDLAWHAGMSQWQALGELTGGRLIYTPNQPTQQPNGQTQSHVNSTPRRVTVSELYGRAPTEAEKAQQAEQNQQRTQTHPAQEAPEWMGRHRMPKTAVQAQGLVYAPVATRFLAFCINMLLWIASLLPLMLALANSGIDFANYQASSMNDVMAKSQALSAQMMNSIPESTILLSTFLMLGLVVVQLIMIAKRGQSIGKLVTGIRVVSDATGKVPTITSGIGVRTVLLYVIYQMSLYVGMMAPILMAVNYLMAATNSKKQGWHDKLAKTVVVKANPNQLNKK